MSDTNPPADHPFVDQESTDRRMQQNLKSRSTWKRLLFMAISYVLISLASLVGTFIIVFGFLWLLFTGEINRELKQVGKSLAAYIYENVMFLTFNTEEMPFPLGKPWPSAEGD
ncbi:MAG: DUF4389 domain-containing protein [Woeseiaceae bacterium]|nr:DUF4389 domain-containing protein [Woeseiaceae bacterium]